MIHNSKESLGANPHISSNELTKALEGAKEIVAGFTGKQIKDFLNILKRDIPTSKH